MRRTIQGLAVLATVGTGVAFLVNWPAALVTVGGLLLLDLLT